MWPNLQRRFDNAEDYPSNPGGCAMTTATPENAKVWRDLTNELTPGQVARLEELERNPVGRTTAAQRRDALLGLAHTTQATISPSSCTPTFLHPLAPPS